MEVCIDDQWHEALCNAKVASNSQSSQDISIQVDSTSMMIVLSEHSIPNDNDLDCFKTRTHLHPYMHTHITTCVQIVRDSSIYLKRINHSTTVAAHLYVGDTLSIIFIIICMERGTRV